MSQKKKMGWPAEAVEFRPIAGLVPYARNARTHSDEQIAQIAASMQEWGWTNPILIDESGVIIAGHGRISAANRLGWKEAPVMVARGWSESKKQAYVLADNKLALNAGWDHELLSLELKDLGEAGFDLSLIGFSDEELERELSPGNPGLTDPDDVPGEPDIATSACGDIWVLGKHRLACGDCTDALIVDALLGPVKPHLMVTDPPYGVNYDPTRTSNNKQKSGKVTNDDRADWYDAWALFPGDVAYVWHATLHTHTVLASLERAGFDHRAMIVWAKDRMTMGRGHYQWQHEPAWYVVRGGKSGHWHGGRNQTTVWDIKSREDSGHGHGTQKPVECMRRPLVNNSTPGQAVYEPFCGPGTTIIAAEMEGRCCYAIEINPSYVDIAVLRWQEFTGQQAVLEADGTTFEETRHARTQAKANPPKGARRKSRSAAH